MRDISYKARSLLNGTWYDGYYFKHYTRTPCPIGDKLEDNEIKHYIIKSGFSDWGMPRQIDMIEVHKDTVCEFTGLYDINKNMIYENDLLKLYEGDDTIYNVKFLNSKFSIFKNNEISKLASNKFIIVGNLYNKIVIK